MSQNLVYHLHEQGCHKEPGAGDFPRLLLLENRRKIEPKEIPSHLIPRLLVVFTWQLEILVTTLHESVPLTKKQKQNSETDIKNGFAEMEHNFRSEYSDQEKKGPPFQTLHCFQEIFH